MVISVDDAAISNLRSNDHLPFNARLDVMTSEGPVTLFGSGDPEDAEGLLSAVEEIEEKLVSHYDCTLIYNYGQVGVEIENADEFTPVGLYKQILALRAAR